MGFIESVHSQVGLAFSIVGLILVVPSTFLFKQYFRYFDHLQLTFLYWMVLAPSYDMFAGHLSDSWSEFIPNFLKFCTIGDLVCQLGFALSFTICLLGVIFLLWLIVTIEKCRKPDLRFEPVYSVFKGFFRWTYISLAYFSLTFFITDIKNGTRDNFISSIVILAWTVVFPVIQLIFCKIVQTQNDQIWVKWFEFLGYYRHLSIVVIFVLSQLVETNTTIAKYFVYGPLVLYAALYLWKGVFMYNVLERVLFGIGEAAAIAIYSLFMFDPQHLHQYELDFLGLALILLIDIVLLVVRLISWLVYEKISVEKINPQETKQETKKGNKSFQIVDINEDFKIKKQNKYDESDDLQNSRDELINSPKKAAKLTGRKR